MPRSDHQIKQIVTMLCCDSIAMLADVAYQRDYADSIKADIATLTDVMKLCVKAQAELSELLDADDFDADEPDQDRTAEDDRLDDPRHGQGDILREGKP